MLYTHAIIASIPSSLSYGEGDDKKVASKADIELARKQQEDLTETLKEAGVEVVELLSEEGCPVHSLHLDDLAIVINGTALVTRTKRGGPRRAEVAELLSNLAWDVRETPEKEHGKPVVLEGSDVLFTGREIFVGVRKNGTNVEGAMVVARTFPDWSVISLPISGHYPLKHFVSLATEDVLTVGKSKEAQAILHRLERDATFRYKILSLDNEEAVCCMNVNNHLIVRHDLNENKYRLLQPPTELWGVTVGELIKLGSPMSKFTLLAKKLKTNERT